MAVELLGVAGLPEIRPGDDLAALILAAARLDAGSIVAVAQKIVSKAEGAVVDLRSVEPSARAAGWARRWKKDPRLIELVLRESRRIVKMERGVIISQTLHGFVTANAGVDWSNTGGEHLATILPRDPDASARRLKQTLGCGAVIITDTFGRPWRQGLVNVAIGVAGLEPLEDLRGQRDRNGRPLQSTLLAVADELAAAAGLIMRKTAGAPVVVIRGWDWKPAEGSAGALIRPPDQDLFR